MKLGLWLIVTFALGGCASQSSKAISKLVSTSQEFSSTSCENARQHAWLHDEAQKNKIWVAPSVIFLAGPVAVIPVLATSIALNSADQVQANDISKHCGGQPLTPNELSQNIAIDATLSLAVGGIAPAMLPKGSAP
ncbi:MAG: hypothetical protein ACKO69_01975 [Limnohabitans sp.]